MKTLYKRLVYATPSHPNVALLLLRLWFGGALALAHGLPKLGKLERFVDSVAGHGVPLPTLSAGFAVTSELIGGLLLALGLFTRAAGCCVLATMLTAGLWVHAADPFFKKELALSYAIAAACLALIGPGRLSLDAWRSARR